MTLLDRPTESLVPLYRQISDRLSERIAAGEFGPGAPIPSEHELCAMFGVSRITVRKAIDELVNRNMVVRRHGRGTFVSGDEHGHWQVTLTGVLEDVLLPYHFKVTREGSAVPPADVLAFAEIVERRRYKTIEGVNYSSDGAPLVHVRYFFPPQIGKLLTADTLIEANGAIRAVEQVSRRKVHHARQIVEPMIADDTIAEHLEVPAGTALLRITRVFHDLSENPIQLYQGAYHPTHYRYTATLYPRSPASKSRG